VGVGGGAGKRGLDIQHAKRMRLVILSSVTCLAPPYFLTLSHKRHDFLKKVVEYKMCVLIVATNCMRNISHFKNNSARFHGSYEEFVCGVLQP
jgi:hypothetical protein